MRTSGSRGYAGSSRTAPATATTPRTTLTYRHQRQDRYSVRNPPSSSPTAPPAPAMAPKTPNALPRSAGSVNVTVSVDSAAGASIAPNAPCAPRPITSTAKLFAAPPSAEAAAKPTSPMISIRRRPTRSDSRPPSSRRPPKASEYAVTTHCRSALENPRSCWAEGSAMFTIVASRTTISWASPTTPRIHQRRADSGAIPDVPGSSDLAATTGSLITGAYVGRRRLRKALRSAGKPLVTRRLDVPYLIHGLAKLRELVIHRFPRPVRIAKRFMVGQAVPGVIAQSVGEGQLLVRGGTLRRQVQPRYGDVGGQALRPLDRGVLDRHEMRVGLYLDHEVECPRPGREGRDHRILQVVLRRPRGDPGRGPLSRLQRVLNGLIVPEQERHVAVVLHVKGIGLHRRVQQLHEHVQQVRVEGVDRVRQGRLGAYPLLQLRVLADVRGNEARRADQDQVLGGALVLHQLGARYAHHLDADRTLAEVLDIRWSVRAGAGETHPRRVRARLCEQAVPKVVRQPRQHGEFAAQHAEGLGVAEPLRPAGEPVLPGEFGEFAD